MPPLTAGAVLRSTLSFGPDDTAGSVGVARRAALAVGRRVRGGGGAAAGLVCRVRLVRALCCPLPQPQPSRPHLCLHGPRRFGPKTRTQAAQGRSTLARLRLAHDGLREIEQRLSARLSLRGVMEA